MEDINNVLCKDGDSMIEDIEIDLNELRSCRLNEESGGVTQKIDSEQLENIHELATQDG